MLDGGLGRFRATLESIRREWDKAEEDIKQAEQVCGNIVFPSIKELRYAGRRIAEILYEVERGDPEGRIEGLLHDALFDCYRARHDAIDAATAKIAADLDAAEQKIGYNCILRTLSSFPELRMSVIVVRDKILQSRANRQDRDAIYATLSASHFVDLCKQYALFQASEKMMVEMAKQERRRDLHQTILAYGGILVGVAGIVVGALLAG